MASVKTKFSPTQDGFSFVNRFEFKFPVQFKLPLGGMIDLTQVVYGLCGGMCFSALDYFYANQALPEETQVSRIDNKLFVYLADRQMDSMSIPVLLKVIRWMVSEDRYIGLRMSRYELPKLRRRLDKGEPVVLGLIRVAGLGDPTRNHQVLATGYDYDQDSKIMVVHLYDPNHPGKEPTITLDLKHPSAGIPMSQSTGEFLRGFFTINYTPQTAVPSLAPATPSFAAVSFDMAPQFSLRWPVDSHRVNQFFGENPKSYEPFGLPGHEGLDLFAPNGANVYAGADGEVYRAGHPKGHPYGLHVRIRHEFGGKVYHSIYGHLSKIMVESGQQVSAGELIGLADNTGNSFGSHLHLTLKVEGESTPGYPSNIVDPWPYLEAASAAPSPPPVVELPDEPLPEPSGLSVYTSGELNLRAGPSIDAQVRGVIPAGEALSVLGQAEQAGPKIGKADEWLQVQTASGLPGYVAAWLVYSLEQAYPPSDLVVYPNGALNMRSGPATVYDMLANLAAVDPLTVLGDADNARAKIGKAGEWLQVQAGDGQRGFVAAWLVHTTGQALPDSGLAVYPTVMLNVRARPSRDSNQLTVVTPGDSLTVLGDRKAASEVIGQADQWLEVRTPEGYQGFVAAWLVRPGEGAAPGPPADTAAAQLSVYPIADLNVRAQPSANSPRVGGAFRNEALQVIEADLQAAQGRIGQQDEWLHVQTKDGKRGWAAAWYLGAAPS